MAARGNSFHLAMDLGAESGRAILGRLVLGEPGEGPPVQAEPGAGRIETHEVHRFAHEPVDTPRGLLWDMDTLWTGIRDGIRKGAAAAREQGGALASLGVDTWGVDYALLDAAGEIVEPPHTYRDPRNAAAMELMVVAHGDEALYRATGNQLMPFNTLFQLVAQAQADPSVLERAERLLFMPDLFHYMLTGCMVTEASIASTSQMMDPRTRDWHREFIASCGLPTNILGEIHPAGTVVGKLVPRLATELGAPATCQVIAPATHDTASAVAAVPADSDTSWAYLSSGTWSLLGTLLSDPVLDATSLPDFTHELGAQGEIRYLKLITGLWLVQGIRKELEQRGQIFSYGKLQALAATAPAHLCILDEDDSAFQTLDNRIEAIQDFARRTHQPIPETPGGLVRCCLETLALSYRRTLDQLESVLDRRFDILHVVGGGGRNTLLDQMTADAIGRPVIVGPYEATSLGNLLLQARALGWLATADSMGSIIRNSCEPRSYEPHDSNCWDRSYARYLKIKDD